MSTPTADRIRHEWARLAREEGKMPMRLRITGDVLRTLRVEVGPGSAYHEEAFRLANPADRRFLSMKVEEVPVGTLDAPGWQIMVTEEAA